MSKLEPNAYTIGHRDSYEKALAAGTSVKKLGKTSDYEGGWVWATRGQAQTFINKGEIIIDGTRKDASSFRVYGVHLENGWEKDVSLEMIADGSGAHALLKDSELVTLTEMPHEELKPIRYFLGWLEATVVSQQVLQIMIEGTYSLPPEERKAGIEQINTWKERLGHQVLYLTGVFPWDSGRWDED